MVGEEGLVGNRVLGDGVTSRDCGDRVQGILRGTVVGGLLGAVGIAGRSGGGGG